MSYNLLRKIQLSLFVFAATVFLFAPPVRAATYPDRAVHLIVGVAAGGGTDSVARIFAQHLSELWGQPVIVENRLGAAGAVANEFVTKAPADGYTLLFTSDDLTALSAFRAHLPYDLLRDLTPVSLVAAAPNVLVVNASLPVHSVKELIALAKSEPGKLTYGSSGLGGIVHLQTARFASMAGITMVHVPYKGSSAAVVSTAEGEVDMIITNIVSERGLIKAGKLRALGITSPKTWPLLPSVPPIDATIPGFSYEDWFGVFAPANLPAPILQQLSASIAKVVNTPEMKTSVANQLGLRQSDSPAQFSAFVKNDLEQKISMVKLAGLKPQ